MTESALASTPAFTPLLATGVEPEWSHEHEVTLSDGSVATVARCSLLREHASVAAVTFGISDGIRKEFQMAFTQIPETIGFVPNLLCHPRDSYFFNPASEPASLFRLARAVSGLGTEYRRVRVAEPRFRRRYFLRSDADVGENWMVQLFSPAFLVWCADVPPTGFGFELTNGWLTTFVSLDMKHIGSDFEPLVAATSVVSTTLRKEALEERGLDRPGSASLSDRGDRQLSERLRRKVEVVRWPAPPESEQRAARPYIWRSFGSPRLWISAAIIGFFITVIGGIATEPARRWILVGSGVFVTAVILWQSVSWSAHRLGRLAFAGEYAKARRLHRENPRLFQARNMDLRLHAVVDEAFTGNLGSGLDGSLVFLHGTGHDAGKFYDAVVADIRDSAKSEVETKLGQDGQAVRNGKLVVWWPVGRTGRSIESLDYFVRDTASRFQEVLPGPEPDAQ